MAYGPNHVASHAVSWVNEINEFYNAYALPGWYGFGHPFEVYIYSEEEYAERRQLLAERRVVEWDQIISAKRIPTDFGDPGVSLDNTTPRMDPVCAR